LRGFFAGVGVETQLVGKWFVRGEYRYTQFLAETVDFCGCATLEADTSIHTGKIVLVYRFGSGVTP
jgi:opacity protein-like surface antigen